VGGNSNNVQEGEEEEDSDGMEEVEYHELQGKPQDIVPAPRYPMVAFELKAKVPRAVRQAVLDKFLEETLRKHHFLRFGLGYGTHLPNGGNIPRYCTCRSLLLLRRGAGRGRVDAGGHKRGLEPGSGAVPEMPEVRTTCSLQTAAQFPMGKQTSDPVTLDYLLRSKGVYVNLAAKAMQALRGHTEQVKRGD
jgi:hypothetical protein